MMDFIQKYFLILLISIASVGIQPAQVVHGSPNAQVTASDLIAAVNALRLSNGLPAYTVSPILMGTAQAQADYMAATGSVTHYGPGGINLTQRLLDAGYPLAGDLSLGGFRAENITGGRNKTAGQAVQEWTGDAPHLNTMLSPNLQEIGAGVARVGDMVYLVIDCALPTTGGQQQAYTPAAGESGSSTSAPSDFIVPIVTSTPDQEGKVFHEVQYGQTLWSLAIAYGVKIDEIRALNNLSADELIYQGERLLVRVDAPAATTPTGIEAEKVPATTAAPTLEVETISASPTPLEFPTAFATQTSSQVPTTSTSGNVPFESQGSAGGGLIVGIAVGVALLVLMLVGLISRYAASRAS